MNIKPGQHHGRWVVICPVGWEFLNANGVAVKHAYDWMLGANFAGGYVEVLRDGQKLRIDGFEPGKIGVLLEDRGPDAP